MATRLSTQQKAAVSALTALGIAPEQARAIVGAVPAQEPKAPKANTFHEKVIRARVPCAYGVESCGRFAPNGVGSRQHTTCPKGRAALAKARK